MPEVKILAHHYTHLLFEMAEGSKIAVEEVAQHKADPNKYEYNGRISSSDNYPDTYTEYATLSDLTFEDNELSFAGYHERYQEWLAKKRAAFNKKIKQLEEENRKRLEEIHCQAQENKGLFRDQQERLRRNKSHQSLIAPQVPITDVEKSKPLQLLSRWILPTNKVGKKFFLAWFNRKYKCAILLEDDGSSVKSAVMSKPRISLVPTGELIMSTLEFVIIAVERIENLSIDRFCNKLKNYESHIQSYIFNIYSLKNSIPLV